MACGCCGATPLARRPVRSVQPTQNTVVAAAAKKEQHAQDSNSLTEERRKVEKLRRDAILRALGRPS